MSQPTVPVATQPVLRALLDEARRMRWHDVLGVRARPDWPGPDSFVHEGVPVRVVPCVSALAVREALLDRGPDRWIVVLTDRDEADLGAGLLSHFAWHRLRTPDPWDAVRHRFAATGIDPALTAMPAHRDLAAGLLVATPSGGWPPAPAGVLTRDHALAAVARTHLRLGEPGSDVDPAAVLLWTLADGSAARVADLRALSGDTLTDAVLAWAAGRSGAAARPLLRLLRSGQIGDVVPLGLVVGLLVDASDVADTAQQAREALVRLEPRLGESLPAAGEFRSWAAEAAAVTIGLLDSPAGRAAGERILARADTLLAEVRAVPLAGRSELLPAGLTRRLARLAAALVAAVGDRAARMVPDPDAPRIAPDAMSAIERTWIAVTAHALAADDVREPAFRAAVRLTRWLALPASPASTGLAALMERHRDTDAWVDSAVNDAATGVGDPDLGTALAAVLDAVRTRRDVHDTDFAAVLARHTEDDPAAPHRPRLHGGVRHVEDLLPDTVIPLALRAPVLLLVMDGMSVAVATEVMSSVLARATDGWVEALLPQEVRRAAALAALPTLTEVSRASLLCGELGKGGRNAEQRGYAELTRAHGLPGAVLFHKRPLDDSRPGRAVADDVGAAIDDVAGRPLVACVLNAIDDALDRSDPGGTDWGVDAVKHLRPLLDRARLAGRVVVLTADHGFVIERRQGNQRRYLEISSARSRAIDGHPAGRGEVTVAGRRVLEHGGRAVLAVDERLRYGPLKAGYHGGASPAEAAVPVCVLVPGAVPDRLDLRLAPPQEPAWWLGPVAQPGTAAEGGSAVPRTAAAPSPAAPPTLFDVTTGEESTITPTDGTARPVVARVLASKTYAAQKRVAGRVSTTDDQVRLLLAGLLAAPGHRLSPTQAAAALDVAPPALRGAVLHAQRLLNVESYAVLRIDADGVTVVLDEPLLREQFQVRG